MHHCGRLLRRRERRPGTIYSRYGGKEGLFSAIVEPVAKEFTGIFIGVQEKFHAIESDRQAVSLDDYAEDGMKQLVKYMYAHLEEFQILVKSSYGTRFQDFVEHLVELETGIILISSWRRSV